MTHYTLYIIYIDNVCMCDYLFGKIFRAPKNPRSDNWIQV